MWHLKTKLGTFWLIEKSESSDDPYYFLGVDDRELGTYSDVSAAAQDVYKQETGFLRWDSQSKVKVPCELSEWIEGEPENWMDTEGAGYL